jgi:ATP-dependent protease ClpP protease subunit
MKIISSPVVTIISGEASSVASHISIAGDKRVCYEDAVWFDHKLKTYFEGGSSQLDNHNDFIKKYKKLFNDQLRTYTKLTEADIKKVDSEDLYLYADEMLEKGIVDEIILY